MATAHKNKEDVIETESDPSVVREQAQKLASWIRESSHFVAFTGAGISTSAGIPDFRGPKGVWTLKAQGKAAKAVNTLSCIPTKTHMALVALERAGFLKFLVSQNTDGLHRKSGFPTSKLAELHGNSCLEKCPKCKKDFLRDFRCRKRGNSVHNHKTDRNCPSCGGPLYDSIINFGESLPDKELNDGEKNGSHADLMLALGSSLTVTPAADIPLSTAEEGGRLVICNLQRTPLDRSSKLRIFSKTDQLMTMVMEELDIEIPQWDLVRRFRVNVTLTGGSNARITFKAEDVNGLALSLFRQIQVGDKNTLKEEPYRCEMPKASGKVRCVLNFFSHYGEPSFVLDVDTSKEGSYSYQIRFDLKLKEWQRSRISS